MHLADASAPAHGAYTKLEDLIALRFPARQLQLARRNRALSALTGPNKSNFRGRGIDFEMPEKHQVVVIQTFLYPDISATSAPKILPRRQAAS